jgi:hypothetical protein
MILPPDGTIVMAVLRNCSTGAHIEAELLKVDEDDVDWRTTDDGSEVDYGWDVVSWRVVS